MIITLAIEKFIPSHGGAEKYCWDLAHFLASRGDTVEIVCLKGDVSDDPRVHVNVLHPVKFPQFLRHLSYALLHRKKVRELDADVNVGLGNTFHMDIYQPHGGSHYAWSERELLKFDPSIRPLMKILRRMNVKNVVQRAMEWWIFNRTRPEVIAISEMVKNDIVSWFDYPDEMIHLVPNGIDTSRFSSVDEEARNETRAKFGMNKDDFVFLFVATNLKLKGFDVVVDACVRLVNLDFKVLVAGPVDSWARKCARSGGVEDKIVFAGKLSGMETIYPACDCLVHPSYYDACSLVVLEALSSGIRVITTDANGASMYVTEKNGYVIPPRDPAALSNAMRGAVDKKDQDMPPVSFKDHNEVFADVAGVIQRYARKHQR